MKDQALQDLLSRADEASLPPALSEGIAQKVRRKQRRRTRRGAALAVLSVACIAVLITLPRWQKQQDGQIALKPTVSVEQLQAELAACDAAAELHQRAAHALELARIAAQRRSERLIQSLQASASNRIDEARDRAALLLLREGERAADNPQAPSSARESYQRAARLFPETPAGRLAAERLALLM
jgi:hypothetical protein